MRAIVRRFHSPDLRPATKVDVEDFAILMQMMVGPKDAEGEESFDVLVCSPQWVARRVREAGPLVGRHHLIVESFDLDFISKYLRNEIESLDEPTWERLANKIGRIGKWEFEDYQPAISARSRSQPN